MEGGIDLMRSFIFFLLITDYFRVVMSSTARLTRHVEKFVENFSWKLKKPHERSVLRLIMKQKYSIFRLD
jgi:hypothetical protein